MRKNIERILEKHDNRDGIYDRPKDWVLKELTTYIKQREREAVEGFAKHLAEEGVLGLFHDEKFKKHNHNDAVMVWKAKQYLQERDKDEEHNAYEDPRYGEAVLKGYDHE